VDVVDLYGVEILNLNLRMVVIMSLLILLQECQLP
jgi:hypothetical protein